MDRDYRVICWTITAMLMIWTAAVLMIAADEASDRQQPIPSAAPVARPGEFVA